MLLLILTGLGVTVPEPTPAPTTFAGNPSSRRGVYTGKWVQREIKPRVQEKPKLSRRERKRLNETARILQKQKPQKRIVLPQPPSLDRATQLQSLAQEIQRSEEEKKARAAQASLNADIELMLLEARQKAFAILAAQAKEQQEQEEISLLMMLDDI